MKRIIINPKILSGKSIFENTRIPLNLILEFIAQGHSFDQIIKEYPSLTKEDLSEGLKFIAQKIKEEKNFPVSL